MPGYRPPRPPENLSKLHALLAIAWDYLLGGKFPFIDTDSVKWVRTDRGYAANVQAPGAAVKPAPATPGVTKPYAIKALGSSLTPANPDLLICSTVTGGTSIANDTVYVAKRREMRRAAKEYFYDNGANVTQTYTYFGPTAADASYGDNFRLGADGVTSEVQSVDPRYYTTAMLQAIPAMPVDQSLIYAKETGVPTGVKDPNGKDITLVEDTPRMWAKVVNA